MNALSGLRVIDLSRVLAGPYCTMLLADYGADVIKVEEPQRGDGTRQWGPPWVDGQSAYYLSVNRNKRSLTVNLRTSAGRKIIRRLVSTGDILVENFKVGTMKQLGLDYDTLSALNSGLIYCSITGYGQTGPLRQRPGYDFMIQAEGGVMSITGPADGEPFKVGVAIADVTAGLYAVTAILAAVNYREKTGAGQYIDVALFDSQLAWLVNVAQNHFVDGGTPKRFGNAHPNIVPYETFATQDGFLALAIGNDRQYQRFCEITGHLDLWDDERFQTNAKRVRHRELLIPLLQVLIKDKTTQAWLDLLTSVGIPAGAISDIPTALNSTQAQARHMVQEITHPDYGVTKLLGPVAKLSQTPAAIETAPPTLGEHTQEILINELGYSEEEIDQLRRDEVIS